MDAPISIPWWYVLAPVVGALRYPNVQVIRLLLGTGQRNPPEETVNYEVTESCGSVFYDVNAYKKPNKLGSDQFIIPVGLRGMQFDNGSI